MTHGWIEISTQVFTIQAESRAEQQGWDLKVTAKATVEGATGGTQDSLANSWEQKFGTKVESDTVKYSKLGDKQLPVAIFLICARYLNYSVQSSFATIRRTISEAWRQSCGMTCVEVLRVS